MKKLLALSLLVLLISGCNQKENILEGKWTYRGKDSKVVLEISTDRFIYTSNDGSGEHHFIKELIDFDEKGLVRFREGWSSNVGEPDGYMYKKISEDKVSFTPVYFIANEEGYGMNATYVSEIVDELDYNYTYDYKYVYKGDSLLEYIARAPSGTKYSPEQITQLDNKYSIISGLDSYDVLIGDHYVTYVYQIVNETNDLFYGLKDAEHIFTREK